MTRRPLPRSSSGGDERRRTRRAAIVSGLQGHVAANDVPITVREISLGGMAIETASQFAIGAVCDFHLEMGDGAVLELRGRALHSRRAGGRTGPARYVTGFEFIDMDDARASDVDDLMHGR